MAKVILTIADNDDSLDVKLEFKPNLKKGQTPTAAQSLGIQLADELMGVSGKKEALSKWSKDQL